MRADHNIALMMKQTQSSLGRIMETHLPPVKLKWLCLRIHPSVSLLSVTPWLSSGKDRKGMQFIKSAKGKMLVKLYCPEFWLIVYVASLIQSYSPTSVSVLSCGMVVKTWGLLYIWLRGQLLFSLLVQLCGPCYTGHYHLHLLPAEVLCVLYQPARSSPSALAVWVVDHSSHVSSILCVQDPQHRLCGSHQCEPLHRHQWQCGHFRTGAVYKQCKCPIGQSMSHWLALWVQESGSCLQPYSTCL